MAMLLRSVGRQCLLRQHAVFVNKIPMSSSTAYEEMRKYWDKNRQLNRPLSPFLSSYRPHLAMSMSLTHRVTGVGMSVVVSGVSVLLLCLPEGYPYYLQMIKDLSLGPAIITGMKYTLALPVTYHFLNGIRHLAWDAGYGFALKNLYQSGYFVMALSLLVSSGFVFGM
ncbi:succinate dehydrogenase cytochrome b560 subunit, mitochondrial-like [Haliotis rubra]|uniref:succinate dehydrogenase cytochrome b560 subunit, mitochondrial-like n=1 Tax=Haliotis rubra TaxID=36100 RepID=UPI001EE57270|nr:succinate dehydrogenase cytochrome b560 subunit, mitochondrial-like [Haliotis rubra]